MAKILVLCYSVCGHIERMAEAVAEGAGSVAGATVTIKRVPDIVGTPTRLGNMAAQMRNFLDRTGSLRMKGSLVGKIARFQGRHAAEIARKLHGEAGTARP